MPVKIMPSNIDFSNKPETVPKPKPPYEWYPTSITLCDGKLLRISIPMPDRIAMVIDITNAIFGKNAPLNLSVPDWVQHTGKYLTSGQYEAEVAEQKLYGTWYSVVSLRMGQRDSYVRFQFTKAKAKSPAKLRIEMNPRKLGPEGVDTFLTILKDPNGPFNAKTLLQWAHVTRLDIAVDIVGLRPDELVIHHPQERQRQLYVGTNGDLETLYLHKKGKKAGPGRAVVTVYDRVRERVAKGKLPPFGPAPVTRIEITKRLNAPKNSLAHVASMPDPYGPMRVGYFASQFAGSLAWWKQYIEVRRACSHLDAAALLGLSPSTAKAFASAYQVPHPELIAQGLNWHGWKHGLKLTGLQLLIDTAA
jgi:hypothetical protein